MPPLNEALVIDVFVAVLYVPFTAIYKVVPLGAVAKLFELNEVAEQKSKPPTKTTFPN